MEKKPSIGRAEVEVLRWIADRGGTTVTEAGDHLTETKGQTRNTALNMMERLRQKGFLERRKVNGVYRYFASESKGRLYESFVEDFVDTMLGGSLAPLAAYLTQRADVDENQLRELNRLIESLEGGRDDT
jgi:predicted transcriptional regulator